jgi:hypothetical protein
MTTPRNNTAQTNGTIPVACALTSADLVAQFKQWKRLIARAMTERAETADGLRICFRQEPGVEEELRTLVATENDCCPWATWTVTGGTGTIVLDVRSMADGIATLHTMFTSAAPAK